MGILDIFGWEDIRKQPAYKKGKDAIEMTENKEKSAEDVKNFIRNEYKGLDKVHRDLFRRGWRRE
jgi:hypothetical protein